MGTREIRDAVHVFVRVDEQLKVAIATRPVQRLRHIKQLAMADLLYPGAAHSRFEHSLGVMELAGRVFDAIVADEALYPGMRDVLPELRDQATLRSYWRRVVQMAALCHDIGHAPFSHAAERLFPDKMNHEAMTRILIESDEMADLWESLRPVLDPTDLVKLAVGPGKAPDLTFTTWESILSEIIVGDAFGVDRMDYLLRDSHHMGVVYGHFDQDRLIDSLRILPAAPAGDPSEGEPTLGVTRGGLQSAEALLMARYFMYSQVYFHGFRMAADLHLIDYLSATLDGGRWPADAPGHLAKTEHDVLSALLAESLSDGELGLLARRLTHREHFRILYEPPFGDIGDSAGIGLRVFERASERFDPDVVKHSKQVDRGGEIDFPVLDRDGSTLSSLAMSEVLLKLPPVRREFVFISPDLREEGLAWVSDVVEEERSKEKEVNKDKGAEHE